MFYGGADAVLRTAPFLYFLLPSCRAGIFFGSPLMLRGHLLFTFGIT